MIIEYPKILYHQHTGTAIQVEGPEDEAVAIEKHGFSESPASSPAPAHAAALNYIPAEYPKVLYGPPGAITVNDPDEKSAALAKGHVDLDDAITPSPPVAPPIAAPPVAPVPEEPAAAAIAVEPAAIQVPDDVLNESDIVDAAGDAPVDPPVAVPEKRKAGRPRKT